jgi:hypothetical protein
LIQERAEAIDFLLKLLALFTHGLAAAWTRRETLSHRKVPRRVE